MVRALDGGQLRFRKENEALLSKVHAMLNIVFNERLSAGPGSGELMAFTTLFGVGIVFWVMTATAVVGTQFYSAFLTPVRSLAHALISLVSVPQTLITRFARNRIWPMLQKYALGLNGYAFELPQVATEPALDCPIRFKMEELPVPVAERAIAQRGNWVQQKLGVVSASLSVVVLTPVGVESLLKDLAKDLTLVHAAYYIDAECIDRIADWIVGAADNGVTSERPAAKAHT
jgi:hypothetical protein